MLSIIEPPNADPHVRWCGRGPAKSGPYPDHFVIRVSAVSLDYGEREKRRRLRFRRRAANSKFDKGIVSAAKNACHVCPPLATAADPAGNLAPICIQPKIHRPIRFVGRRTISLPPPDRPESLGGSLIDSSPQFTKSNLDLFA